MTIGSGLLIAPAVGQVSHEGGSANSAQAGKQFAFEVFSIRLHKRGTEPQDLQYLPDGYKATVNLGNVIKLAYIPLGGFVWSSSKILNAPDWVAQDRYDIDARVAPVDMAAWQQARDRPDGHDSELLHSAWRAVLRECCKLAFHTTPIEVPCLNLMVGKHGAKLKVTVPGAVKPVPGKSDALGKGFYIQDKGERQFVGVSMEELARSLMRLNSDRPIQDKTGLTGRYDFTLPWYDDEHNAESEAGNPLDRMPISSIGLMLKPGRGPGIIIIIDHIEKPDAN
jgi:uncharacterized protein (TIGR03435 family)